ncbi:hypothetical protein BGW39_005611 [Mortierella sp. 14UC]|nr:hypothetical protein BGW39_005611 [Mortierella sp. 14UC]
MSTTTTLLAWLIPCLILAIAFIAWRVYVYKTQGPFLPESLRGNIFARTRSMVPRTLSFNSSNKNASPGTLPTTMPPSTNTTTRPTAAGGAIRNETRIDIPSEERSSQPPMSSIPSTAAVNMIAPVQNQLSKSMLTHIGIAMTLGTSAAYAYWHKVALHGRYQREAYYVNLKANKA